MKNKVNSKLIDKIIILKKKGVNISNIAKQLGISDSTVLKYSRNFSHPNKKVLILIPESAKQLSINKAELLGYLCSEGNDNNYIDHYIEYDKRRHKSYIRNNKREWINFSNTNKILQDRFIHLMISVYDYPLKVYNNNKIYIKRKEVVKDLRKYTLFGSRKWDVPKELFKRQYKEQAKFFIKAYLDGDGSINKKRKTINVDSVNKPSLNNFNRLLNKLGIKTNYYQYETRSRIIIKDINKYKKLIGFLHPDKLSCLREIS